MSVKAKMWRRKLGRCGSQSEGDVEVEQLPRADRR